MQIVWNAGFYEVPKLRRNACRSYGELGAEVKENRVPKLASACTHRISAAGLGEVPSLRFSTLPYETAVRCGIFS